MSPWLIIAYMMKAQERLVDYASETVYNVCPSEWSWIG